MLRCRKPAGFNGAIMVERLKVGATTEETTANGHTDRGVWKTRWLPSDAEELRL